MLLNDQANNIIMLADDIIFPIMDFFHRNFSFVSQLYLPYDQITSGISFAALLILVVKLSRLRVEV